MPGAAVRSWECTLSRNCRECGESVQIKHTDYDYKENAREFGAHMTGRPGLLLMVWDDFPEEVPSEVRPLQNIWAQPLDGALDEPLPAPIPCRAPAPPTCLPSRRCLTSVTSP